MHHNPIKKFLKKMIVTAALFGLLSLVVYKIGLPYYGSWAAMFTFLAYKTIIRKVM